MNRTAQIFGVLCLVLLSLNIYLLLDRARPATSPPLQFESKPIVISDNIKVPEPRETPTAPDIAVPNTSVETLPGSSSKTRSFTIEARDNIFSTQKIAVYQDDVVHIDFMAKDKTYDLTVEKLGLSQTAKAGETKVIEFQALTPGSYLFSCKTCTKKTRFEGTSTTPQGVILVLAKA